MSNGDRSRLAPLERGVSVVLGAALGSLAVRRRTPSGALLGAAGGYLLLRGLSGRAPVREALGLTHSGVGTTVSACSQVTIDRAPGEIFEFLREMSNFVRFSTRIVAAERLGPRSWRLTARSPLPGQATWVLHETVAESDSRLAWCTEEGEGAPGSLELRLRQVGSGTEVHADAWFVPPAARVLAPAMRRIEGSRPLRRAGLTPSQHLSHELRRLRQLLEAGETATVSGQSSGRSKRAAHRRPGAAEGSNGAAGSLGEAGPGGGDG